MEFSEQKVCGSCGYEGPGYYCGRCGQPFELKKVSLKSLIVDAFQFFTNFEKGFGYTFKELVVRPGTMQWRYLHEDRTRYQKPISFLLISATLAAFIRYGIFEISGIGGQATGITEAIFFREYWTITQLAMMPVYILLCYLFFINSKYNYAEAGIVILYLFAILFMISAVLTSFMLIIPGVDTALFELPVFVVYVPLTVIRFFKEEKKWIGILKSLILLVIIFALSQVVEDYVKEWLS